MKASDYLIDPDQDSKDAILRRAVRIVREASSPWGRYKMSQCDYLSINDAQSIVAYAAAVELVNISQLVLDASQEATP